MGKEGDPQLEDLAHERAIWKLQHFAWGLFALILLAALLGVFGRGLLSESKVGNPNAGLWAEYDRFGRYHAPSTLKLHLAPSGNSSLPAVWLGRDFVDRIEMQQIYPQPERVKVGQDRLIYIFNVARTNESAVITFHYKPDGYGKTHAKLGLENGPELQFSQFVYP